MLWSISRHRVFGQFARKAQGRIMTRVAIYCRLSLDLTGEQTATARQEAACRSFASAREWTVIGAFEDVDLSAYKRGVHRPAFERLLELAGAGDVDGIVVWKLDRLVRRPSEFERFWAACEQHRVFIASVTEPVDSSTDIGLAIVRVLVTFASLECATNGLRLAARHRERAEQGLPHTSVRAFGHQIGWKEVVPEEADAIRDAAKRILVGESALSVCRDWAARGITTVRGKTWQPNTLIRLLCSPRVVGDRAWRKDQVVATGCFAPILDRTTHLRVRRLAASRAIGQRKHYERSLLSGMLTCGECGATMHSRGGERRYYVCPPAPIGCGRAAIVERFVEPHVVGLFRERLRDRPPQAPTMRRFDKRRYTELVERLERIRHDYYVTSSIDDATFRRYRDELDTELRQIAVRSALPPVEGLPNGFDLRYAELGWPALTQRQRRELLRSEISTISVARAGRTGNRFDPARVEVTWRS
jgi:site-specific DNA recombinase